MKPKNTAKEKSKALKSELLDLTRARNRALSSHSFKLIQTRRDFYISVGFTLDQLKQTVPESELSMQLTREYILTFFDDHRKKIEAKYEEPVPVQTTVAITHEGEVTVDDAVAPADKLPDSPNRKCQLFAFQERAASAIYKAIVEKHFRALLLRAEVGTGKTFMIGAIADLLRNIKFCEGKTFSPWPMVYVTKASIVAQTERVLRDQFGLDIVHDIKVINIEQLRASFGELMVRAESVIEQGEEHIKWKWRPGVHPLIIFWDECQILKNTDSQQSRIAQAFNEIDDPPTVQVFFSATPYMRVCEGKCFGVATKMRRRYGVVDDIPLSNETWKDFATHIAHPAEPEEYSPAAMKRFMDTFDEYIVQVKGVRPQYHAINSIQLIEFRNQQEREFYKKAWDRYEEAKRKAEGYELSASQSRFLILAQFTIFRRAAEMCRAEYLADAMYDAVMHGEAACLAVNFKGTIRKVTQILNEKYNISRDDISLIWGGGKTKKTKKQEQKENIAGNDVIMEALRDAGISLKDLNLEDVADYEDDDPNDVLTKKLRLGDQNPKERQKEIDRFQSGKSRFCMFTFKAGGVGLSLHHTDELTKEKCRRKKNNWVYPEDVPTIPTRPRVCFLAPTFSAIELVQGLGRCPRLTSLSDTKQVIVFYAGTIEERVAAIVNQKLKCLREVVRNMKESWDSVVVDSTADMKNDTTVLVTNNVEQRIDAKPDNDDNTAALFGSSTEDEDEDED